MRPLNLDQLVHGLGGVADRAALLELTARADVDRALREGRLVRVARGRYALPAVDEARRQAGALHAVASHLTAAQAYGCELKHPPQRPSLTVRRKRRLAPGQRVGIDVRRADLTDDEIRYGWLTSPERTFVDCCRHLPFDEALVLADSLLRWRHLTKRQLVQAAGGMRGPGAPLARRVAREASGEAANVFESVLRSIALEVPGLSVRPQVTVVHRPFSITPDLVDERLRLAIEAESFAWHGDRAALRRDCQRYTTLAIHGWRLARFSWEDVMHHPAYVREALTALVDGQAGSPRSLPRAA